MSHTTIAVDPSIIVQSSLALVMAITMTDAVKATVEHAGTVYPGSGLYHKFIAVIVVVVLIMMFSMYVSKHRPGRVHPTTAGTNASTNASTVSAVTNSAATSIPAV